MSLLKALHLANDGSTPDIDRRFMGAISLDGSRVIGAGSLVVTEKSGTPNMSVDVAAGRAWVLGSDASFQGSYYVDSTATENVTIAAADSTNDRIDLIVATVRDDSYGAGSDDWLIQAVEGTPAASPTVPTVPDSSIVLARVDVEANETSILNADITDLRSSVAYNAGGYMTKNGLVVTTTTNLPSSPEVGDRVYSTSVNRELVYTGSAWVPASGVAAGSFSQSTDASGYITVTHGLGFTPSGVIVGSTTIGGPSFWDGVATDTYTSTTFRARLFLDAAAKASVAVTGNFIAWR